jgi:hypothetical protein
VPLALHVTLATKNTAGQKKPDDENILYVVAALLAILTLKAN